MIRPDPIGSLSLKLLLKLRRRLAWNSWILRILSNAYDRAKAPIRADIHGQPTLLNPGNRYPFILQDTPFFNAPLIELVNQAYHLRGRGLRFVDVGAAIGDSVLLIKERCAGAVDHFICVEGDAEFHGLLAENMSTFPEVTLVSAVLAKNPTTIKSLVKHHKGTAASMGDELISAVPLDSVEAVRNEAVDILKIDVDGFDGEVLGGSTELLRRCHPYVIFEWHPKLILATGCDPFGAFDTLRQCGYDRYLWFNNIGTFSHFTDVCSQAVLASELNYLLKVNPRADEHFDIIALPNENEMDAVGLAAMEFARSGESFRYNED